MVNRITNIRGDIRPLAFLISLILSGLMLLHNQPFNSDGVLYLQSAQAFLNHGFHAAKQLYGWPYFSIIIATVSKITSLSLLHSAQLLSTITIAFLVVLFITLVKELGGDYRTQCSAALIILISHYFNHMRADIVRDFFYLIFTLYSMVWLIRFSRDLRWSQAIAWFICLILATFFRAESLILLVLAPQALWVHANKDFNKTVKGFAKIYLLPLIFIIVASIISLTHTGMKPVQWSYINSTKLGAFNQVTTAIQHKLQTAMPIAQGNAINFVLGGLILLVLGTVFGTIGVLYTLLSGHALCQRLIPWDKNAKSVWITFIVINALILSFFVYQSFFLSARYVLLLVLVIMLAAPFSLIRIYDNWRERKPCLTGQTWLFVLVIIVLIYTAVAGLWYFGPSKAYVLEAGAWIKNNTAKNASFIIDDERFNYYMQRPNTYVVSYTPGQLFADAPEFKQNWQKYDYTITSIGDHDLQEEQQLNNLIGSKPIATFKNKRGDRMVIYKNKP